MSAALSYELHKLTARLDRVADALLRRELGLSYSRFLALFGVQQGAVTQRNLAEWLGQSEPATSRMVASLARAGLLDVRTAPGAGNRKQLRLAAEATVLVDRCLFLLDERFKELVRRSGVDYSAYQRETRSLLTALDQLPVDSAVGRVAW